MYASYLRAIALFLLLAVCGFGTGILLLSRAGEYRSLQDIVAQQQSGTGFCLYGSVIHNDSFPYKLEGQRRAKAEVVSLGTSRVLQFRRAFFRRPFYNMGFAIDSIEKGRKMTEALAADERPKLILLGVEPWWFNRAYVSAKQDRAPLESVPRMHFLDGVRLAYVMVLRRLSPLRLLREPSSTGTSRCLIGLQARMTRSGFGPDGSYYYTNLVTGFTRNEDERFQYSRDQIETGRKRYLYGTSIDPLIWNEFVRWMEDLQSQGTEVVVFLPPFSPSVSRFLKDHGKQYAYIDDLRTKARTAGIPLLDFLDGNDLGSSDCEFIDGLHGGSVTFARLLLALREQFPALHPYVDTIAVRRFIEENAGNAAEREPSLARDPEVDFLKIGCSKL